MRNNSVLGLTSRLAPKPAKPYTVGLNIIDDKTIDGAGSVYYLSQTVAGSGDGNQELKSYFKKIFLETQLPLTILNFKVLSFREMHLNILSLFSKITSVFSKSFYFKIVFNVYLFSWIKVYFSFNLVLLTRLFTNRNFFENYI